MKTIWKFPFEVTDTVDVQMPLGAEILHIETQQQGSLDVPCMWALVDPNKPVVTRRFKLFGTGHPLPEDIDGMVHVGTFLLAQGNFVGHLFHAGIAPRKESLLGAA